MLTILFSFVKYFCILLLYFMHLEMQFIQLLYSLVKLAIDYCFHMMPISEFYGVVQPSSTCLSFVDLECESSFKMHDEVCWPCEKLT